VASHAIHDAGSRPEGGTLASEFSSGSTALTLGAEEILPLA